MPRAGRAIVQERHVVQRVNHRENFFFVDKDRPIDLDPLRGETGEARLRHHFASPLAARVVAYRHRMTPSTLQY